MNFETFLGLCPLYIYNIPLPFKVRSVSGLYEMLIHNFLRFIQLELVSNEFRFKLQAFHWSNLHIEKHECKLQHLCIHFGRRIQSQLIFVFRWHRDKSMGHQSHPAKYVRGSLYYRLKCPENHTKLSLHINDIKIHSWLYQIMKLSL